jgi:protein Mpv17
MRSSKILISSTNTFKLLRSKHFNKQSSTAVLIKQNLFSKYLIVTNVLVSAAFSGFGDITEQVFELASSYQQKWNLTRTVKLTLTGLPVGLVCHYWYLFLDKHFYNHNHKTIFTKVILSQVIFSPICIVLFFATLGYLNQSSKDEIIDNIETKGKRIYLLEWAVWPPASLLNFYFIPLRYRVLYDNIISFGFDIYNSYIVHKHLRITHSKPSKSIEATKT